MNLKEARNAVEHDLGANFEAIERLSDPHRKGPKLRCGVGAKLKVKGKIKPKKTSKEDDMVKCG